MRRYVPSLLTTTNDAPRSLFVVLVSVPVTVWARRMEVSFSMVEISLEIVLQSLCLPLE